MSNGEQQFDVKAWFSAIFQGTSENVSENEEMSVKKKNNCFFVSCLNLLSQKKHQHAMTLYFSFHQTW